MVIWGRASAHLAVVLRQEGALALLCGLCLARSWWKLPRRREGAVVLSSLWPCFPVSLVEGVPQLHLQGTEPVSLTGPSPLV